ncbi:ATP-binding protein [Actinophytocola sp.]|uniref:ATP-binding protein n=1 Tax=Actinophytocola sp. TaxID=1872138 RepID=UPI002ED43478
MRRETAPAILRPTRLRRWWVGRSVRVKGLIVVAIPLIALIGIGITGLVLADSASDARATARRASALSTAANAVLVDVLNAETGARGYALTRDPVFLDPYDLMRTRIDAERAALREAAAVGGDTAGQRSVDEAAGAVLADLTQLISTVDQNGSSGQITALLQTSRADMDQLRARVADLIAAPARLVARQRANLDALQSAVTRLNIGGLAVGVLAGLLGVALFTSGISRRVAEAAVNADRLGQGRPLRPVTDSGDDLGRLARSLVRAEELLTTRTAEIAAARDEALHATQAKNTFLSNTSHELRTPLNSILGFTQLLELSDLSDDDRDSVTRILVAGRHLLALINELIDTARIESGELSLSVEPVSVEPLIREISLLLSPLAAQRSVTIVHDCALSALAVHADRQRLRQVVMNLMSNAVKYNRRGGTITTSCRLDNTGRVEIIIADTGPGLSEDSLQRLFVPFDRLGIEQTGIEGTGIGLPLAKALTEAMGGHLSAASVLGEGSAFTVNLRRAPDMLPHEPTGVPRPAPHSAAAGHVRVLYIEDNPNNIEVVSRYLKNRGNTALITAQSGRAGIELAIRDTPDVILLDLHLPDLHGDHVLKELRAEPATSAIPVAVLSADASPGVIRRLKTYGVLDYLTKPIDLGVLGTLLDSITPAVDPQDIPVTAARSSGPNGAQPSERPIP